MNKISFLFYRREIKWEIGEEVIKEKEYIEKEISRINDLFTKGLMSFSLYKLEVLQK